MSKSLQMQRTTLMKKSLLRLFLNSLRFQISIKETGRMLEHSESQLRHKLRTISLGLLGLKEDLPRLQEELKI